MEKSLYYWLADHQSEDLNKLNELNELLHSIGVEFAIKQLNSGKCLRINYDTNRINQSLKRRAGRKKIACAMDITVEDVRERMDRGESAEMIASELGISRSTLFRKLKYAEEHDIMFL